MASSVVVILALVNVAVFVPGLLLGRLDSARYLLRAMSAAALAFTASGGAILLAGYLLYSGDRACGRLVCPFAAFVVGGYGLQALGLLASVFASGIALAYVNRWGNGRGLALLAAGLCLPLALLEGYIFLTYSGVMPSAWLLTWGIAVGATWAVLAVLQPLALLAVSWRAALPRMPPAPA
jgi:hypothetical protein